MHKWFECKVKYQKITSDGKEKQVSEPFLVDALSFTEAETRINQELEPFIAGEFEVTNIKKANYSELIPREGADRWFKCKVSFFSIDEEKGVEKRTNTYMLVQSNTVKEAFDVVEEEMKGTASDYSIPAITESPILDVFPYFNEQENEQQIPENLKPLSDFVQE